MKPVTIRQGNKTLEYSCLLIEAPGKRTLTLMRDSGAQGLVMSSEGYEPQPTQLSPQLLPLLPPGGRMVPLGASLFVSDVYEMIRLCKQGRQAQVLCVRLAKGSPVSTKTFIERAISLIDEPQATALVPASKARKEGKEPAKKASGSPRDEWGGELIRQRLLGLVNTINTHYKLPATDLKAMSTTELLIDALKAGLERLRNDAAKEGQSDSDALHKALVKERDELKKSLDALNVTSTKQKQEIEGLRSALESVADCKAEAVRALDRLKEQLAEGGYLFDCATGDDKSDSHLAEQTELLRSVVNAIEGTPGDVRKALKEVIKKELATSSSVLSQAALLAAYARLPFMIEPRQDGCYIISSRVSYIYNIVEDLLTPLGLHLVLPLLFVETPIDGDGRYEDVTGNSMSTLANTFCPNLLVHKASVDRDQRDRVITDVILPGVTEEGKLIQKAQVVC